MAAIYAELIIKGLRKLADVPERLRGEVEGLLTEDK